MTAGNPTHRHIQPGDRFSRLVVVEMTQGQTAKDRRWLCQCDCGKTAKVLGYKLNRGLTKSCGCYNRRSGKNLTHGQGSAGGKRSPTYRSWSMMLTRCNNPNNPSYPQYGARGIKVCDRWHRFEDFYADMGDRPEGTTIDRIDNSKGYEPGNCRWATRTVQSENRSVAVMLTHDGTTMNLSAWARKRGLDRNCVAERLKLGWSDSEALGFVERERWGARSKPTG